MLARRWMARLPFRARRSAADRPDRQGHQRHGHGHERRSGRKFNDHEAVEDEYPKVQRIAVRGLTEATHGNAVGIGMAEFCRSRVLREADLAATRLNVLTSGHVSAAMPPLDYETDREMLDAALGTIGLTEPPDAKLLWIADTLAPGRGGMLGGLSGRSPQARRPGNSHPASGAAAGRGGESAGPREWGMSTAQDARIGRHRSWTHPCLKI